MSFAIMQPYIFPYIGYYQLVKAVDKFILYDDVTFIKGGYINRNNILVNGESKRFTIPVIGASSNKLIKDIKFSDDVRKVLLTIKQSYSKANYFSEIYPMVEDILMSEKRDLAHICGRSIFDVLNYLGIKKDCFISSEIDYDRSESASGKIFSISKKLREHNYINSLGGQSLYCRDDFEKNNLNLRFIKMKDFKYPQGLDSFVPHLSIIDILMQCHKDEVVKYLNLYELV